MHNNEIHAKAIEKKNWKLKPFQLASSFNWLFFFLIHIMPSKSGTRQKCPILQWVQLLNFDMTISKYSILWLFCVLNVCKNFKRIMLSLSKKQSAQKQFKNWSSTCMGTLKFLGNVCWKVEGTDILKALLRCERHDTIKAIKSWYQYCYMGGNTVDGMNSYQSHIV